MGVCHVSAEGLPELGSTVVNSAFGLLVVRAALAGWRLLLWEARDAPAAP